MIHKIYQAGVNVATCGISTNERDTSFATQDAWEVVVAFEAEVLEAAERNGSPPTRYLVCKDCKRKGIL